MARKLEHVEFARRECESFGAAFSYEHGGAHLKAVISYAGFTRTLSMSWTPSDVRCLKYIRRDVRRAICEMAGVQNIKQLAGVTTNDRRTAAAIP